MTASGVLYVMVAVAGLVVGGLGIATMDGASRRFMSGIVTGALVSFPVLMVLINLWLFSPF